MVTISIEAHHHARVDAHSSGRVRIAQHVVFAVGSLVDRLMLRVKGPSDAWNAHPSKVSARMLSKYYNACPQVFEQQILRLINNVDNSSCSSC